MVLLAASDRDLQCTLGQFAAEWELAGMRISTSKSKVRVLYLKTVDCSPLVGGEWEMDMRIKVTPAKMWPVYRIFVVKREL